MDYFVLTVASLILFAATFFSTVTGFGFALIAAPVLTMVMGPKETVVFVIIAGVIVRVIMMWRTWGEFEWPTVLITAAGSLLGIIPGAYLLKVADANHLKILLGIALLLVTLLMELNLLRANMIWIFAIGSFCTLGSFFVAGTFQGGNLIALSLYVLPAVLLGWWLGEKMFFRINQHLFKRIALLVVLIGGVMTLGSGINGVLH